MQTVSDNPFVGQVLGEKYVVEQFLGSGALTAAYLGRQLGENRQVMITMFLVPEHFSAAARQRFSARFLKEAEPLKKLYHPHILPLYDFGEQASVPYLICSFTQDRSLARIIKDDQARFTPEQTLAFLYQLAEGLDYAHQQGVVHGSLSPATILLNDKQTVSIAGFGFVRILAMSGIEERNHQYAHLLNITNSFLGVPSYIAPESVQSPIIGASADIYATGLIIFQMLSGIVPFTGSNPLEVALQRLKQPLPSLQTAVPDLPPGLDLVVQRALEVNPAQRFQSVGEFARAFARVLNVLQLSAKQTIAPPLTTFDSQVTQPPTVNWQALGRSDGKLTAKNDAVIPTPSITESDTNKWQILPPLMTGKMAVVTSTKPTDGAEETEIAPVGSVDPFLWWSTTHASVNAQTPGTFTQKKTSTLAEARRKGNVQSRRRTLVLLASGGVVAAGVLGIGGVSLARLLKKPASPVANGQTATHGNTPTSTGATQGTNGQTSVTPTTSTKGNATPTTKPTAKPTTASQATPTPQPGATQAPTQVPTPTAQPTQPPAPTPTPQPQHTGTVIGNTNQGVNSSVNFTNPADGNASMLIHLQSGNFAAYETACSHEGAPVRYDAGSQKIICTRHTNGMFDPNSGSPIGGPPPGPLRHVTIRVNADGTITTG